MHRYKDTVIDTIDVTIKNACLDSIIVMKKKRKIKYNTNVFLTYVMLKENLKVGDQKKRQLGCEKGF